MLLARENIVTIIGTLESNNMTRDNDKGTARTPLVKGNLVIKVTSPKPMSIPINYYVKSIANAGTPRKLYGQIETLKQGQRINIQANIRDNKFWDESRGQLVRTKRLELTFINAVKDGEADRADFSFSGYVSEPLKEVHSRDGELTGWALKLAQANYLKEHAEVITFNVDPNDQRAISYIKSEYTKGKTVKVSGLLDFDVKTETVEQAVDFGQPIVKTYQRTISNLVISSGVSVTEGVYEIADIDRLNDGDLANDKDVELKAKGKEKSGAAISTNKPLMAGTSTNQILL